MNRTLFFEIKKLINEPSLYIISIISIFLLSIGFVFDANQFLHYDISNMQSASNMWILFNGGDAGIVMQRLFLDIYLLVAVPIIIGDSYLVERENNIFPFIHTRTEKRKLIIAKTFSALACAFFVVAIPLIINQLLCLIVYPAYGYETFGRTFPTYSMMNEITKQHPDWQFQYNYPYLYNIVFIIINTTFAWLTGLFSHCMSLWGCRNKLALIITPALIFIIFTILVSIFGNASNNFSNYLAPGIGFEFHKGLLFPFSIMLYILLLEAFVIYLAFLYKKEELH